MSDTLRLQVEILTGDPQHGMLLSEHERAEISRDTVGPVDVDWVLPPRGSLLKGRPPRFGAESALLIYLAVAHSPFGKKLQELAAEQIWDTVKLLVAKIVRRQKDHAYRLRAHSYLVLQAPDYELVLPRNTSDFGDESPTIEQLQRAQRGALDWYEGNWEKIGAAIERVKDAPFDYEELAEGKVFVLTRLGDNFSVRRQLSRQSLPGAD